MVHAAVGSGGFLDKGKVAVTVHSVLSGSDHTNVSIVSSASSTAVRADPIAFLDLAAMDIQTIKNTFLHYSHTKLQWQMPVFERAGITEMDVSNIVRRLILDGAHPQANSDAQIAMAPQSREIPVLQALEQDKLVERTGEGDSSRFFFDEEGHGRISHSCAAGATVSCL